MGSRTGDPGAVYEIQVQGRLDQAWQGWLNGLEIASGPAGDRPPVTRLTGSLPDQAALRGLLGKLWDLNLTLISVRRIAVGNKEEHGND